MKNGIIAGQAVREASFNGIDIYTVKTEKFKTCGIHFFFQDNLTRENATKNALLPAVMRRGSEDRPTSREISANLEDLYGASFDCGVAKKGERHIMHFYTEYLSGRYMPGGSDMFARAFDLLYGIISRPLLENGQFRESYVAQEKDKLKMLIESRVNDKVQYSIERCLEETCREEPYHIYDYGFIEDLGGISPRELTEHYRVMTTSFPLQVYLVGDISESETAAAIKALSGLERGHIADLCAGFAEKRGIKPRYVTDIMNVTQGKLCLGFRTNTAPDSGDYYSLMMYNGILGGGVHSKLFQNVREKAGMAYYAHSILEKYKGLMVVSSGIEAGNRDKALNIIQMQLEDIKKGLITDHEMEATAKSIETGIKSLADSQTGIVDFYLGQAIAGTNDNLEDVIGKVKKVKKDDVVRVAGNIVLDTVYFLSPA